MSRQRASAVIINGNSILMVKISDHGRSWWCLPGGTLKEDETPEEAVVRELQEELNVSIKPGRRLYEAAMPYEPGTDLGILIEAPVEIPRLGIDKVVVEWAWRPLAEVGDAWQVVEVRKALLDQ
ncbi:MAG: NUDIX hydrolase [Chloroflexi bacterium]|nr:NUDIX hydrolase [Chloroflexota bacterium]